MKKIVLMFCLILIAMLSTGCYLNEEVATSEMALKLEAGQIKDCVGPGKYTGWGFWDDLQPISVATLTFKIVDPEVATYDNQLVGVDVAVQARRMVACDGLSNIAANWPSIITDEGLISTVTETGLEAIKNGTRDFTLTQLLDDRNGLAHGIREALQNDADLYSVQIINVMVSNIAINPEYAAQLNKKALITAETETSLRQQDLINQQKSNETLEQTRRAEVLGQQLLAEKAQTAVELEIAGREGRVIAAQNLVYLENERAYELERLRLMANIFGDKVVFMPVGTDLTLLIDTDNIVPLDIEEQ